MKIGRSNVNAPKLVLGTFGMGGGTSWQDTTKDDQELLLEADPEKYVFTKDDYLGVVFPAYFYAAPDIVLQFARSLKPGGAYTFVICNYSNVIGEAMEQFSRDALHCNNGYGLLMPDNSPCIGSSYNDEQSTLEKLKTAETRLAEIITRIKAKEENTFIADKGENAAENTAVWPKKFREELNLTTYFYVEKDKCVSCGKCAKICSAHAIELKEGYPVWVKEHCNWCLACINRCPKEAIQYSDKSQGVYRYTFDKYYSKL